MTDYEFHVTNTDALEEMIQMATDDLHIAGEWSSETANERCRRYASLIRELITPPEVTLPTGVLSNDEPIPASTLFPNGRCPVCGNGLNWAEGCCNNECQEYVSGAELQDGPDSDPEGS